MAPIEEIAKQKMSFSGTLRVSVGPKGRIILPLPFREVLQKRNSSLEVYIKSNPFVIGIIRDSLSEVECPYWSSHSLDKQGRIKRYQVPKGLKSVELVGCGDRILIKSPYNSSTS